MKLKIKNFGITTGYTNIVIINKEDAHNYDFHAGDRGVLRIGNKKIVVVIDIMNQAYDDKKFIIKTNKNSFNKVLPNNFLKYCSTSNSLLNVNSGEIGLFQEVTDLLNIKEGSYIFLTPEKKPESLKYIKKKIDGLRLTETEILKIVKDIVSNNLTEVELTYFVSAVSINKLDFKEITYLTKAVANTGEKLRLTTTPILDKHCIGGVPGNRTTMILVPILAALGFNIPKTSSRAITSPAGTADTMELLANVSLSTKKMKEEIKKIGGCIVWGGALNLAPADDKIIRIERPLSIDVTGLMLSSVMAKKYSVGATHVIIDIPYGKGAKIRNKKEAEKIKKEFLTIGRFLGMKLVVVLTDGSQPIGNGIGPLLESIDVMKVLNNDPDAPIDLKEKAIFLAGTLLNFVGEKKGFTLARDMLESGLALKKMNEIIDFQGRKQLEKPGPYKKIVLSINSGVVKEINNIIITKITRIAGAPLSSSSGLYLYKKKGDKVNKGEKLFTIFSENKKKLSYIEEYLKKEFPYIIK